MDTVIGAAIGAIAVLASNWLQARRERQREQQAVAERAGEAARVRAQDAALLCDRLFTTLRTLLPSYLQAQRRATASDEVEREAGDRVRSALDEIEHAMVDLPGPVQARVSAAVDYLRWADDLADYGHHYHSYWSIVHNTCRDIH